MNRVRREPLRERLATVRFPPLRDVVAKKPSSGRNLDVLDGVRGLAVLIVIAAHSQAFALGGQGAAGVFLFFALSAFLLTLPFASDPSRVTRPAALAHYAKRRLGRILPPYYLLLAAWYAVQRPPAETILRHALFVQGDVHLWSIPQEMLFYVLLPLAVLPALVLRHPASMAAALLAAAALAARFLDSSVVSLTSNGAEQRFFLAVFLCGMAAAYASRWDALARLAAKRSAGPLLAALGFAVLAALLASAREPMAWLARAVPALADLPSPLVWFWPARFGLACAVLIWIGVARPSGPIARLFSAIPLRALGLVSYSAYLIHLPLITGLKALGVPRGAGLFALALTLTYAAACVTYTFVERPFTSVRR